MLVGVGVVACSNHVPRTGSLPTRRTLIPSNALSGSSFSPPLVPLIAQGDLLTHCHTVVSPPPYDHSIMSSGASDQDYNIWSVVASVLGILGLVPVLWDLFKSQLPLAKLRELEASLQETKEMLDDGVEQGLLHPEEFRLLMKACVFTLSFSVMSSLISPCSTKAYIDDLKGHIYAATSLTEQFRDWRNGLCAKMDTVLREIHRTRATVAVCRSCVPYHAIALTLLFLRKTVRTRGKNSHCPGRPTCSFACPATRQVSQECGARFRLMTFRV